HSYLHLPSFPTRRSSDLKVLAQIDFIEDDDRACAAFMCHNEHLLQNRRVETHVRGGHQERRVDIRGKNLLCSAMAGHLARELSRSEEHTSELQSRVDVVC